MKIKITGCCDGHLWYADRIGEVYLVRSTDMDDYGYFHMVDCIAGGMKQVNLIRDQDCETLTEETPVTTSLVVDNVLAFPKPPKPPERHSLGFTVDHNNTMEPYPEEMYDVGLADFLSSIDLSLTGYLKELDTLDLSTGLATEFSNDLTFAPVGDKIDVDGAYTVVILNHGDPECPIIFSGAKNTVHEQLAKLFSPKN